MWNVIGNGLISYSAHNFDVKGNCGWVGGTKMKEKAKLWSNN